MSERPGAVHVASVSMLSGPATNNNNNNFNNDGERISRKKNRERESQ